MDNNRLIQNISMSNLEMKYRSFSLVVFSLGLSCILTFGQKPVKKPKPVPPVAQGADGRLVYASDSLGNRIPDFSFAGYMAGEKTIPTVPVRVMVPEKKGDATLRIQAALDYVASLPLDKDGFRGAVLLGKGTFEVEGSLSIKASGVILRGSGPGKEGTILIGAGKDRQTLIRIIGKNDRVVGREIKIKDAYVPVNATKIKVSDPSSFKAGDMVQVHHPNTWEWIRAIETEGFGGALTSLGWKPGDRDLVWDRRIVSLDGETLTLDAPITTALDTVYGGGFVATYQWKGRIRQVGIENLCLQSTYDVNNQKDEAHRWMAITIENAADVWVRQMTFEHFAGSSVAVWETSKRITIEDCQSLAPVSEIGGQRRYSFWTTGQQVLFQRLYAEYGYHDFAAGLGANLCAFVQCEARLPYSYSGGIDSWASGILYDIVNVDGNALSYKNLGQDAQGAGWNAANSVFWNCSAARVDCFAPPTAQNWAFGTWAQFAGDGYWGDTNNSIQPRSFYYEQLKERLGEAFGNHNEIMTVETEASSSPSVAKAAELVAQSTKPLLQLTEFIDQAAVRNPISTDAKNIKTIDEIGVKAPREVAKAGAMKINNGWIVRDNALLTGNVHDVPWWRESARPGLLKITKPALTRFVPGRTGTGLTDDLSEVVDSMIDQHVVAMDQHYALWYDRRRDDHERIRRMDGEVWAPFYEVPFARSGKELAWDGLSKYDLTKYNTWYWSRLKQFADLADQKGLVLLHENYFQHNIIEAGAHWVDCPWRSANNINQTGFPEPPPFAGDKRIFTAELFYDITHPVRSQLHKAYIRQCLENFKDNSGVIQLTSAEFTGPFHFVKFWLETIRDWEKETGKKEMIGLSTTKDVQDSILDDPSLASIVDVIDIRYWFYRSDGTTYAPKGGQSLAPRQHARLIKPGRPSFEQVYRAVSEYKQRNPEKAVIFNADGFDAFGWAVFMAGGSLPCIPVVGHPQFLADASGMKVMALPDNPVGQWALESAKGYIVYNSSIGVVKLDLTKNNSSFTVRFINPFNGHLLKEEQKLKGGALTEIKCPTPGPVVAWISKI
jgi:hypothetical protein